MVDHGGVHGSGEVLVPIGEALPGMRIVGLPAGERWVGALIFVKTQDDRGEPGWSMRRTGDLSDEELLGTVAVGAEMLRDRIRLRERR
jgi:hypothetical protein